MTTKTNLNQKVVYDPNSGRNVLEMKPSRSFYITTASTAVTTSPYTLASTVVGYNQNIMITGFSAGLISSGGGGITTLPAVTLCEGSSSITSMVLLTSTALASARPWQKIVTTSDAPILYSVGSGATSGTRTLAIYASTDGTYQASLWGRIEPVITHVMP